MWNLLIDFLTANEDIRYDLIIVAILTYLFLLWVVVSIWVILDAKKRYESIWISLMWGVLVLILNFPILILYLMLRPEDEWWKLHHEEEIDDISPSGGVNVPLVNFVGENGQVALSFEVKINPQSTQNSDMSIEVGWNDKDNKNDFKLEEKVTTLEKNEDDSSDQISVEDNNNSNKDNQILSSLGSKITNAFKLFSENINGDKDRENNDPKADDTNISDERETEIRDKELESRKKKKKKKKKRN